MSDLRARIIRLAHEKPELRDDLLPLLDKYAEDKTASLARELLFGYVDRRGLIEVQRSLRKSGDEQSSQLIRDIQSNLLDRFNLDSSAESALNRLAGLASRGKSWDPALQRNNVFKIANSLGIKLPSGMF